MKLKYFKSDGSNAGEKAFVDFPVFEGGVGESALRDLILAYEGNQRQGTASTKTRGEVAFSGKKPWRQKGTGRARCGEKASPLWRKGGVVFGPKPRDYSQKMNKKVKTLGLSRALYDLAKEGGLSVIESFAIKEPKTKLFVSVLDKILPEGRILIIDESFEKNTMLSARNIPRAYTVDVQSVNAWDLVRYQNVLISEKGILKLIERLKK